MSQTATAHEWSRDRGGVYIRSRRIVQLSSRIPVGRVCGEEVSAGWEVEWQGTSLHKWVSNYCLQTFTGYGDKPRSFITWLSRDDHQPIMKTWWVSDRRMPHRVLWNFWWVYSDVKWTYNFHGMFMSRLRGVEVNYLASQARDPGIDSHQHLKDSWHIWRHLRNDTVFSCNLRCLLNSLHGRSRTYRVASLRAGPVGRISYNLYFDCKHVRYVTCDFNKRIYFFFMTELFVLCAWSKLNVWITWPL